MLNVQPLRRLTPCRTPNPMPAILLPAKSPSWPAVGHPLLSALRLITSFQTKTFGDTAAGTFEEEEAATAAARKQALAAIPGGACLMLLSGLPRYCCPVRLCYL